MGKLTDFLQALGVECSAMETQDVRDFSQGWLNAFAWKVKEKHGKWVYRGYRWHGFSYDLQPCLTGRKALGAYSGQWPANFVVFDEDFDECLLCEAEAYPDMTTLGDDVYVTHANLKWTMAFTHEQPELGPYFAENER